MALKAILDSLDGLPSEVAAEYVEKNGKFELQVEGMKTQADVDRLQTALVKERTDHKNTREKFAPILEHGALEEIIVKLDKLPELEAAATGKIDETKINEIVEGRIRTRVAPIERERDKLKQTVAEKENVIQGFQAEKRKATVTSAVERAAKKAGVVESALEDAVLLGERIFDVGEDGSVTVKDNVGYTPGIDPSVWFTELQPKRPHWWGGSAGGGAGGNDRGNRNVSDNPFTHENWNLTKQGELIKTDRVRAEQLAKSAGTTIGGPKPAKKGK